MFGHPYTKNFNPRSPHGERLDLYEKSLTKKAISIHAPRTGSDHAEPKDGAYLGDFNPRSPHGERQCQLLYTD